jgi:hypothetical protein
MLDKYVAMKAAADPALSDRGDAEREAAIHATTARQRKTDAYRARLEQCQRDVSPRTVACGMRSTNPDEWEACID